MVHRACASLQSIPTGIYLFTYFIYLFYLYIHFFILVIKALTIVLFCLQRFSILCTENIGQSEVINGNT